MNRLDRGRWSSTFLLLAAGGVSGFGQKPGSSGAAQAATQQQAMFAMQQAQLDGQVAMQRTMMASQMAMHTQMNRSVFFQVQTAGLSPMQAAILQSQAAGQSAMLNAQAANLSAILRLQAMNLSAGEWASGMARRSAIFRSQFVRRAAMVQAQAAASGSSGQAATSAAAEGTNSAAAPYLPAPMVLRPTFGNPLVVSKPSFSSEGGPVPAGATVSIRTDTHYATIYYTTDGWTPTTESARYVGPITIHATTRLQAIAVGPNLLRSQVGHVDYTVAGSPAAHAEAVVIPADGVLRVGTPLRLVTGAEVSSERAAVGDAFPLLLDQELKSGDITVAAKGTKVDAIVTIADRAGGQAPGDLVFEVQSLEVKGKKIPLFGSETLEGATGMLSSKEAVVVPGMAVTAFVVADTAVEQ
jgi:hypothetical protein